MQERGHVHALPVAVEYGDLELTIAPTAVETERGLVLIDVGPDGIDRALEVHLEDLGYGLEDIWMVLLTHHDGDHAGGVAGLLEQCTPIVAAHPEETAFLTGERDPLKAREGHRPFDVDLEVVDGVRIPTLAGPMIVLETPGHSPGHLSLYLPDERLLIAGDALVADGEEPLEGPKPEYTPEMDRALESLERLTNLEVERVLCHHGGYVEEGTDRIREIHEERTA